MKVWGNRPVLLMFLVILVTISVPVLAVPTVWHPAENVQPGTFGQGFGGGNFSFNGSVGIGTTAPSEKLNVNGSLRVDNATGIGQYVYVYPGCELDVYPSGGKPL